MSENEPVLAIPTPVPFTEFPRFLREFMKASPEDPSAFISVEIRARGEKVWKAHFDVHCEASNTDQTTFTYLMDQAWAYAQDAISLIDTSLQTLGWNASGSWRVRQEPAPETTPEPPPGLTVPIAPTAASDRKDMALERIARVNPHLARMATEVQELMLWDQYANVAMGALIRVYEDRSTNTEIHQKVASEACKYADAMMEARLARVKRPLAVPVEAVSMPEKESQKEG